MTFKGVFIVSMRDWNKMKSTRELFKDKCIHRFYEGLKHKLTKIGLGKVKACIHRFYEGLKQPRIKLKAIPVEVFIVSMRDWNPLSLREDETCINSIHRFYEGLKPCTWKIITISSFCVFIVSMRDWNHIQDHFLQMPLLRIHRFYEGLKQFCFKYSFKL